MLNTAEKVLSLPTLLEQLDLARSRGSRIALANGLFDLLHVGHLRYLQGAAAEADLLVVAVNADASARALKGPSRPVVPDHERAELIAGFSCVDYVTIFSATDVRELMTAIQPDVHCKGTDYTAESVPESDLARKLGIRVAIVGDPKTHATREMIGKLRTSD